MNDALPHPGSRRLALYEHVWAGPIFVGWHWLQWNLDQVRVARESPFAARTLDALLRGDDVMPGFAIAMLDRVATFGGREKNMGDYAQILSWLGEIAVIDHFVRWRWSEPVRFEHEPAVRAGGKNPEVLIHGPAWKFGIEVKTPDLIDFAQRRHQSETQYLARVAHHDAEAPPLGSVTYPRDNPLKDFLRSADAKFRPFRDDPTVYTCLFVVWDDFVNEPLSALLSPASGLLTPASFDRGTDDAARTYPAVDAVVLLRQQHQFVEGLANRPPIDERRNFLDYGDVERFPPNVVVPLETSREPPAAVVDALQAYLPEPTMGAEYIPAELVWWIGPSAIDG